MRAYHKSLFTILCSSLFVACGGGTGSNTDEPIDTGATSDDSAIESGAPTDSGTVEETSVDANDTGVTADASDTAVAETCPTEDPLDDDGRDDNCDGAEGVAADGIYVDPINGVDVQNGSPEHPVQTVERALALFTAKPARNTVYLAKGTTKYNGTTIGTLLSNGCSVVGGLDPSKKWSRPEGTASPIDATTIESPLSGVRVSGSPGARLWWAKITNTGAKDSAHSYGMVIRKSPLLTLHRVSVFAAAGPAAPNTAADGSAGEAGGKGGGPRHQEGLSGGSTTLGGLPFGFTTPPDTYVPRSGGRGGNGCAFGPPAWGCESPGEPGRTTTGALATTRATTSKDGGNGVNGVHGFGAAAPGALHWKWDDSSASIVAQTIFGRPGNDGTGGEGGGGGSYRALWSPTASCAAGSGGGAGGGGGGAGSGGASGNPGGFSIGIVIVDPDGAALPTFEFVSSESSSGGAGGTGGKGGSGGRAGDGGGVGYPEPAGISCSNADSVSAYRGGNGGHGGSGASGPGGMGGSSIGLLVVSKSSTASPFGVSTKAGAGGAGGAAGSAAPPIVTGLPAGNASAAGVAGTATGFLWLDVNRAFPKS